MSALEIPTTTPAGGGGGALELIEDILLGADTASFDFQSIAETYKHLKLVLQTRGTVVSTQAVLLARFNNDSGANYDWQQALSQAGAFIGTESLGATAGRFGFGPGASASAGKASTFEVVIPNYAETVFHKSYSSTGMHVEGATTSTLLTVVVGGVWRSTAAISRIAISPDSGNWLAGSRATLYGMN